MYLSSCQKKPCLHVKKAFLKKMNERACIMNFAWCHLCVKMLHERNFTSDERFFVFDIFKEF